LYSFRISDEIIVQQKHVSDLIPYSFKKKIIGNTLIKMVEQSKNEGFVVIFDDVKNKNPNFLIKLILELAKKNNSVDVICSTPKSQKLFNKIGINSNVNYFENIKNEEVLSIFKNNHCYIHTSKYETVGLPIYEALESGLKVVVPDENYIPLENDNIFKYTLSNIDSAFEACMKANDVTSPEKLEVPVYSENWDLI
jgi:glycosyltransferase involved in cell wall biosynthesis